MEHTPMNPEERRRFLAKMASAVFASMVAPGLAQGTPRPEAPEPVNEDVLLRMQKDLERALKNPGRKWGMVIDLRKCVGCHACTVSCMAENRLPPGVVYRPVSEEEVGTLPQRHLPLRSQALHAVRQPPLRPRLPLRRHLEAAGRHRGD
jgi:molybdopterin-containing oxidoreductase family iron-sulfur binding subunit